MILKKREDVENEVFVSRINYATTPKTSDTEDFELACKEFVSACESIRSFFGLDEFYGSFQESRILEKSKAYKAGGLDTIMLNLALQNAYSIATFEASELGLRGSEWWFKCWSGTKSVEDMKKYLKELE